jgi:hypothetical protein
MHHSDEASKLDVRELMVEAMRLGRLERYDATFPLNETKEIFTGVIDKASRKVSVTITVAWPTDRTGQVRGQMLVRYPAWDGRIAEQMLPFEGVPAKIGAWRWRTTCPNTGEQVQNLYLVPDGDRFVSRKAAQIKTRPLRTREERHWRRCEKLMAKLKTTHPGPGITKPKGMTEREYLGLCYDLTCEHLRFLCAVFKLPPPAILGDEPLPTRKRKPCRSNPTAGRAMFYRDRSGVLHIRAKLKRRFNPSASDLATRSRRRI